MRTYDDIYRDYLNWLVKKTGDIEYDYEVFTKSYDEVTAKSILYNSILEKCYNIDNGLYYFIKFIVGDLTHIGYPSKYRVNRLTRIWDKLVKSTNHLAILSARGHGKSIFFSALLNIYEMFLFPHTKAIIVSASQEQSETILEEIKKIIDNNEWLVTKKDPNIWRAGKIGYNKGYIVGVGIGSEIRGQHVDRIVIDDIIRSDNKLSEQEIEDYIDMVLEPMTFDRRGQMILVGTPKTGTDIFSTIASRIKENSKCPWKLYKFPAIIDEEKEIIQCPDRWSWEFLMAKKATMGTLKFSREMQLEFFSRDASLFPERIVKSAKEKGEELILLDKIDKRGPNWVIVTGVDIARSGSVGADYSVAVVLAYNTINQDKQVVHIWRSKGLKIREQAEKLAYLSKSFGDPYFLVEQNNFGQDMIDDLTDKWNVNVEALTTGAHTTGKSFKKEELIRFLILAFEHEQIMLPQGDEYSRKQIQILVDELKKFCVLTTPTGNEIFKGVGAHDDCVMALALANRATQIVGIPFAVSTFGGGDSRSNYDMYGSLLKNNKHETDLVKMIEMGLIK